MKEEDQFCHSYIVVATLRRQQMKKTIMILSALSIFLSAQHSPASQSRYIKDECDKKTSTVYYKYGTKRYKLNPGKSAACQIQAKNILLESALMRSQIELNNRRERLLAEIEKDRRRRR